LFKKENITSKTIIIIPQKVSVGVSLTHLSARPLRFPAAFLMQANSSALALLVQVGLAKDMSEAEAIRKYSIYQYLSIYPS